MSTNKGFINPFWLLVALVIVLGGGGAAFWYIQQSTPQDVVQERIVLPVAKDQSPVITETVVDAQIQLAKDVALLTPRFIDGRVDQSTQLILQKIQNDIRDLVDPQKDRAELSVGIQGVGQRYVAFQFHTASGQADAEIIDIASGKIVGKIPHSGVGFYTERSYFAITRQDICVYKLDTPTCVSLPGAKLSGDEIYGDDEHIGGLFDPPLVMTHADTSLNITTFRFDTSAQPPYPLIKSRELKFPLP